MAGQPGESNHWAIDIPELFTVGKVRCLTQSRWWSTKLCLFGKGDMAFSWLIVLREELVLRLFLGDDEGRVTLVSVSLFLQRC